jgi:hypothetical protein
MLLLAGAISSAQGAAGPLLKREAEVPQQFRFVRSLDLEGYVQRVRGKSAAQSFRMRTRYLDPDVNAFVGMLMGFHHANHDWHIGQDANVDEAEWMWNFGVDLGLKRGRSIWELDIMGVLLGTSLGPATAIVGEHSIGRGWFLYHRTEANFFTGQTQDVLLDADQGLYWMYHSVGITFGYRIVSGLHMNRTGPRIGLRLQFDNPKIPFLFPSLG